MTSFMEQYRNGRAQAGDMDTWIGSWVTDPAAQGVELTTWLGLTVTEYRQWLRTRQLPSKEAGHAR